MIRQATLADAPHAAALGMQFNIDSGYPLGTLDYWLGYVRTIIEDDNQVMFLSRRGIIAGGMFAWPFCPSHKIGHEVLWWAKDGQGLALLDKFTEWAKARGAVEIQIAHLLTEKTEKACAVLDRKGFKPIEIGFRRSL